MKYGSVCSGIEAATVAWQPLGWKAEFFSEIEAFPNAVLAHHYPSVPNLGDFTRISNEWRTIDLLVGGTPCFPENVTILTKEGLKPISQVNVGDLVLTHKGRWQPVVETGCKLAPTVIVKGQGHWGLETTEEHPFYARAIYREWVNSFRNWKKCFSSPSWIKAKDLKGKFWASPSSFSDTEIPPIETWGREHFCPGFSEDFMWIVGLWVGDGWTRINNRRGYVLICSNQNERYVKTIESRLIGANLKFSLSKERTTARFQIALRSLARWLKSNFGEGASSKTIPSWLLGMPENFRHAFFDGYIFADGTSTNNGWSVTTTSDRLATGITLLAHSLGFSVGQLKNYPKRICLIEGRQVSEKPTIKIVIYKKARSSIEIDGFRYGLVRSVSPTHTLKQVFNLEVAEDNSYVADGITVHNCQPFSIAGARAGLADPRGNLAIEFVKLARRLRPTWLVWENVPGVLSANKGRDFGVFLGCLAECGFGFAYRILDAASFGIPQRRRRVFLIGYSGDWRPAAAVLFERQSLLRHSSPRQEAGKDIAATIKGGSGEQGHNIDNESGIAVCFQQNVRDEVRLIDGNGDRSGALTATAGMKGRNYIAFSAKDSGQDAGEISPTLRSGNFKNSRMNGGSPPAIAIRTANTSSNGWGVLADGTTHSLGGSQDAVAVDVRNLREGQDSNSGTLQSKQSGGYSLNYVNPVRSGLTVRRLTPLECERLMGFPDNYTMVLFRGLPASDSVRYRAIGNSMAVPCIRWIGQRIELVDQLLGGT